MGLTFYPLINHNRRRNKSGKYEITIRVTLDRAYRQLSTGEKIEEKYWLGKENKWVKDTHPFASDLNEIVKTKIDLISNYTYRQKRNGNPITLNGIVEFFYKKSDPRSFNDYVSDFVKHKVDGMALNTIKKYKTFSTHLDTFNRDIRFSQLNESLFQEFAAWLRDERSMLGVTVIKYFDPFKKIVKAAIKDGYLEKDPFQYANLNMKATKGKRIYLEIDEITAIKNATIPEDKADLLEIRKYFLFCFYCGFYYSDLRTLKWESVKMTEFGYVIQNDRFKNENGYVAPIFKFENAIKILEDQRGKDATFVFPNIVSEPKYNLKLKELATEAKIAKNIMNKTARHSFIQFYESQGLETQHLGKMVGHTKESTTKNYYELSIRDVSQRVAKFNFSTLDV